MNIACATDDNYVRFCGVMLTSLFENNKNDNIDIYLLTEGLSSSCRKSLEDIVNHYGGCFHYCKIESNLMKTFSIFKGSYLSIATYYRLFIPQILPSYVGKVLYLDCDIIINSSLNPLWNIDLKGYALGAVDESATVDPELYTRLQYPSVHGYFNAGVLLLNLEYWRYNAVSELCFDYIKNNADRLVLNDQDALNAVLYNQWMHLSYRWNMETSFYTVKFAKKHEDNYEYIQALKSPAIIHYTWEAKPWNGFNHPMKEYFFKYQDLTEWKKLRPSLPFIKLLKRLIWELLYWLRIREYQFVNLEKIK